MTFSRQFVPSRAAMPRWLWWASFIAAIALVFVPPNVLLPVKQALQRAFTPGHFASAAVRDRIDRVTRIAKRHLATVDDLSQAQDENRRLGAQIRRLQAALLAAKASTSDEDVNKNSAADPLFDSVQTGEPLLDWDVIEARVLGYRARAYLAGHHMIAGGEAVGFAAENLVLEAAERDEDSDALDPPDLLIDQGVNAQLEDGQLAIAGRRVLGKLVEVGPEVSFVRRVNESGYRDLVQLATHDGQHLRPGPQGIVHGMGERLCRIQLVKTTEPVEVGDLVFAAGGQGLIEAHLVYGKVARVERSVGDVHWQIWMEPALPAKTSDRVAVLRVQANRDRLAVGDKSWD